MKKYLWILICLAMMMLPKQSVKALGEPSPKEEVVYGMLNADGSVKAIHVVNVFATGTVLDYGNYSKVTNLSTTDALTFSGDVLSAVIAAQRVYIQGDMTVLELPWIISIRYVLDDQPIEPAKLGGKSGKLKISIQITANPAINPTFAANMALQVGVTLDQTRISDLKTSDATLAEAGSSKQITYTVLPGQSLNTVIETTVNNFKMDPITINGIRMTLGFTVDTSSFKRQLKSLSDAITQLDAGAAQLKSGMTALSSGFDAYVLGMDQFSTGLSQLALSGEALSLGADALYTNMALLVQQNDSLKQGALTIQQATFDSVNASLSGSGLPELTTDNYAAILDTVPELAAVKAQLDGVVQFTQGISAYLDGVLQLTGGVQDLSSGLAQYTAANTLLAQSANQLYQSSIQMNTALKQLKEGLNALKQGTGTMHQETSNLDGSIDSAIQDMISQFSGNGDPVMSFVSDKNTAVTGVQFVLKTSAIQVPEADKPADPIPVKRTIWEKLIDLFKSLFK